MRYEATISVSTGYKLPNHETELTIGDFKLVSSFPNGYVCGITVSIEENGITADEAQERLREKASRIADQLTFVTDSLWVLRSDMFLSLPVEGQQTRTVTRSFTVDAFITDSFVDSFAKTLKQKQFAYEPLSLYRQALQSQSVFEEFLCFYRILEYCFGGQKQIDAWLLSKDPNIKQELNKYGKHVTIFTSIRNEIGHAKATNTFLLASRPSDFRRVADNMGKLSEFTRQAIEENS